MHRDLRESATRNRRSMNSEILVRLEGSFGHRVVDVDELLAQIEKDRREIGPIELSDAEFQAMKNEGRL